MIRLYLLGLRPKTYLVVSTSFELLNAYLTWEKDDPAFRAFMWLEGVCYVAVLPLWLSF